MADAAAQARPAGRRRRLGALRRLPAVNRFFATVAAGGLIVEAYVHATTASSYASNGGAILNEGNLFAAEAVVATFAAILLVVSSRAVAWLASLMVAGSALGAVLFSTYVDIGAVGPLPDLYEPTWNVPGKVPATLAEGFAVAASLAGLFLAGRTRRSQPFGRR